MPPPADGRDRAALVAVLRDEGPRVVATLARTTGSLALAEDVVQDAALRALETWPRDGVPQSPRAWLIQVARHRAIDVIRRESGRDAKEAAAVALVGDDGPEAPAVVADDLLRLIFTCCHPSLAAQTQVALSLHVLCGLTTAEVARALVTSEAAMAKRLTRARRKIAVARIPYRVPDAGELPARLRGVLATVYLVFTEGYSASGGVDPVRVDVMAQAVRLARLLRELLPESTAVAGLLALMLLQGSRSAARVGADGELVLLAEQDRTRWDRDAIAEALQLLGQVFRSGAPADGYVAQAAIAGCHAIAPTWEETGWDAILSWYDVLLALADTPVVRLGRAVAIGERDGPGAALPLLDAIAGLSGHGPFHAARGEQLERLSRDEDAAQAYRAALRCPINDGQRRQLTRRLAGLGDPAR